jgi:hypothetical protein
MKPRIWHLGIKGNHAGGMRMCSVASRITVVLFGSPVCFQVYLLGEMRGRMDGGREGRKEGGREGRKDGLPAK